MAISIGRLPSSFEVGPHLRFSCTLVARTANLQELSLNRIILKPGDNGRQNHTLITGATGLVGQYLMRDLLASGDQVAVIVRRNRKESPRARIERILRRCEAELGRVLPRPVVIEGDINASELGIASERQQWVAQHCDRLIHTAATLKFSGRRPEQEPWKTNLEGTRIILEFAKKSQIQHLHYVSTAYVCGIRDSVVYETDFDCGQSFRNDYERSKFEAEQIVRDNSDFESTTIYRPVVICGDPQTGFTSAYNGIYVYLRLFAMLIPKQQRDQQGKYQTRVQLPLSGDEPRNLVSVDWVSRVICELSRNPAALGKTFHLASENHITPRHLIESCYEYFNSDGVEFCGIGADCNSVDSTFANQVFENIAQYQDYETSDPTFDISNLVEFAGHIPCPEITQDVIHRFLDFGISQQWGKKKLPPMNVPDLDTSVTSIATSSS